MDGSRRRQLKALVSAWAGWALIASPVMALNPDRDTSQYKLTRWSPDTGAPEIVFRIDQDREGFLWLATRTGVYRFDGITFEHIPVRFPEPANEAALQIMVSRRGEVWTWYRNPNRYAVYRNGAMQLLPPPPVNSLVADLAETADGSVWAGMVQRGAPLLRFKDGRWKTFGPAEGVPNDEFARMLVHPDGSLWVSYVGSVIRLAPGSSRFETVLRPSTVEAGPIVLDRQSRIWLSSERGTYQIADAQGRALSSSDRTYLPAGRFPLRHAVLQFDRDGNLWANDFIWGLMRVRPPLIARSDPGVIERESFTTKDGLTSNLINAVYEDREGNLWLATTFGLNQLSDTEIAADPALGQPALTGDILLTGRDGTVYIGEQDTLYRVKIGEAPQAWVRGIGNPLALCQGPGRSVVLVSDRRFAILSGERQSVVQPPAGVAINTISSCAADIKGNLWIGVPGKGFFRRSNNVWQFVSSADDLLNKSIVIPHPKGGVLITPTESSVAHVDDALKKRNVVSPDAAYGPVTAIYPIRGAMIVRTKNAILRLGSNGTHMLDNRRVPALAGIGGLAQLPDGTIWTFGSAGIARFRTIDFERAFTSPSYEMPAKVFDYSDGLMAPGTAPLLQTVAAGGDGRLWFASDSVLMTIDSRKLGTDRVAPGVKITALEADGKSARDPTEFQVPAGTRDLRIAFSVLSLAKPKKAQVRYKLEGFDKDWVDPGTRREAFYNNLAPGTYSFRVIAASSDGVWNRQGATLEFTLPPTFVQSLWFKLLLALIAIALGTIAYRFRLHQITARLQARFDARIAERERIARELHDTLLQGIQGLMLRFQSVANRIPKNDGLQRSIDEALDRADAVLVEGRARVRDLRFITEGDLGSRLMHVGSETSAGATSQPEVLVDGLVRELHPLVSEEAQRIAEEAIRNALSHSEAGKVTVQLSYGRRELRLTVRDDGIGFPEHVLSNGVKHGHFGLTGMRERAARVGGRLVLANRVGGGAEVALIVPAAAAYSEPQLVDQIGRLWRRSLPA